MKRYKIITILATVVFALFGLFACNQSNTESKTAVSIQTEYSQYVAFAGCFEYDTVNVVTVYSNGETTSTPLTAEMLSAEDREKQNYIGEHTLTVHYNQMQCTFVLSVSEDVSLLISFTDKTVQYNGEVQSLAVQNLPQGATVSYTNNENKNAGEYTVQAVVTVPGGREIAYQATLTIEKAPLTIRAKETKVFVGYTAEFGYDIIGLVNGETESVFTALPIRQELGTATQIGSYENYVVYTGASAENYEISYVSANLQILPLPQTVVEQGKEYVKLGAYPQTVVSDEKTIIALNAGIENGTIVANEKGYYRLENEYFVRLTADSYINGESYDKFTNNIKIENGTAYYFRVEPIKWRVLSNESGIMRLIAETLLDVQPFWDIENAVEIDGETYNPNNYAKSEIREWLNGAFMQTAFENYELVLLQKSVVPNGADTSLYDEYSCEDTQDFVFLPSYQDMTNAQYGFANNADRMALTSDYVRALGTYMRPALSGEPAQIGYGSYFLRSAGISGIREVSMVDSFGDATREAQSGSFIVCVRPMIGLSL